MLRLDNSGEAVVDRLMDFDEALPDMLAIDMPARRDDACESPVRRVGVQADGSQIGGLRRPDAQAPAEVQGCWAIARTIEQGGECDVPLDRVPQHAR